MIKRLDKMKKSKRGSLLVMVVLILALAMIFISAAMMLTQTTKSRLYDNAMSSQARLTVTAAAEVFLEALETQEITDAQFDKMIDGKVMAYNKGVTPRTRIKMTVPGVPGMSSASDNCTYLDLYYPSETDKTVVNCDFTTVIGDETENVRVVLNVAPTQNKNNGGRFNNQIDIGGDVNAEEMRFTKGVGMTAPDDPSKNYKRADIQDNTILLRGKAFEQSSSSVVYSDIIYAPGSTATWGGGNTFYGNQIFLDNAYMSTKDSGVKMTGDFYFIGTNNSSKDVSFICSSANAWSSADCWGPTSSQKFYFSGRSIQDKDKDKMNDDAGYVKSLINARTCYFVGEGGTVSATNKQASGTYTITNAGSTLPGNTNDFSTAAGKMNVYKQYNYDPAGSNKFPTDVKSQVLNSINMDGMTTKLSSATSFKYDNYGVDGKYYAANSEIPAGTEIITHPVTATYPEYDMKTVGATKVIDPDRTFSMDGINAAYTSKVIDLNKGGSYYFTEGTSQGSKQGDWSKPLVFAIDGSKTTKLYFASGDYYLNCVVFAVYNVTDSMSPVVVVLENGANLHFSEDSQWQLSGSLCSAGFLSLNRGFTSANGIANYVQTKARGYEDKEWEQAAKDSSGNIIKATYSSYYDSVARPNIFIFGTGNNKFCFGNDNIFEAYIGIYPAGTSSTETSGFYSVGSNGAKVTIYGRMEGKRITNGTADDYCMPYCPKPKNTNSQPSKRPAKSKYSVSNVIYYYDNI